MSTEPALITSRDNPFIKALRRLAQDQRGLPKAGPGLAGGRSPVPCGAGRGACNRPPAVFSESFWAHPAWNWSSVAIKNIVVSDRLWAGSAGWNPRRRMGFLLDLPLGQPLLPDVPTVVLDRVQDAGNVGSILRSAGGFRVSPGVALKGTAALWSPKVLRAGMGAHFGLHLIEGVEAGALDALGVPVVVTSSHQGELVHEQHPALAVRMGPGPRRAGRGRRSGVKRACWRCALASRAGKSRSMWLGVPVTIRRTQCFCPFREPPHPPSWRSQTARSFSAIRSAPRLHHRRSGVQHRHHRLPGNPHRPQLLPADRDAHVSAHRQLRRQREDIEADKVHAAGPDHQGPAAAGQQLPLHA
jgi:TrmH family RNA methyltransferase